MRLTQFSYLDEMYQDPKDKITLVGMAHDGPVLRPFILEEGNNVYDLLGNCQIADTYRQLEVNGIKRDNIIIHRLNGLNDTIYIKDKNDNSYFKFKTVVANDSNKLIELRIQNTGLLITKYKKVEIENVPDFNGDVSIEFETVIEYQESYIYEDYEMLSDLANAINQDASLGFIDIVAREENDGIITNYFKENEIKYFENSSSESSYCLNNEDNYNEYKKIYWEKFYYGVIGDNFKDEFRTRLSNVKSELYLYTDVYYDLFPEIGTNIAKLTKQIQSEEELYLSAVISTSLCPDEDIIPSEYTHIKNNLYYDINGDEVTFDKRRSIKEYIQSLKAIGASFERTQDYMTSLQVVIGTSYNYDLNKNMTTIGGYAGTYMKNNRLKPISNKEIITEYEIKEKIFKSDIATLTNYGYIYIVPTIRKGIVPYKAQSFEKSIGILTQLNNKRLVGIISIDIKNIFDKFIGKDKKKMNVQQLSRDLEEYFQKYLIGEHIASYEFRVPMQTKWDDPTTYDVEIELVLYGELYNLLGSISTEPLNKGGITVWETIQD